MKTHDRQSLEAAIESVLDSPMIRNLGPAAHETLEAIAVFPNGVKETSVGRMFPEIGGVTEAANILSKFHLLDRHEGIVKILSPFRFYFLERVLRRVHPRGGERNFNHTVLEEEDVRCNEPRAGSLLILQYSPWIDPQPRTVESPEVG